VAGAPSVVQYESMRKSLLLVLSLLGVFISAYLWWVYTSPAHALVCLGTGCDAVRLSSYAVLWGFPMPIYGVAMYAVLVLLIFAEQLMASQLARRIRYLFTILAAVGFCFSLYLTWLEGFVIHAWCAWCVASAITITFIFGITIQEMISPSRRPDEDAALPMLRKHFTILLIAIVAAIPVFIFLARHGEAPPVVQASSDALHESLIRPDSHMTGNPAAALTVVEFGDFECPACGNEEPVVREILQKYGARIRFIFRQNPLVQIHADAMRAAEASECAAGQGKFWQAVQKLYENQTDLSEPALSRYAAELGLEKARFSQCLSGHLTAGIVRRDMADGLALGVDRTPTFFVGQKKTAEPIPLAEFSQILDLQLAAAGSTGSNSGVAPGGSTAPGSSALSSGGPLLGSGTSIFSNPQGSTMACSNDEAKQEQPVLIRTADARKLFEGGSKPLFVDVRPAREFAGGRIRDAINVPADEFERRWIDLPKNRTIVLYESGKSSGDICAYSRAAGRALLAHGFPREQVKVYQDGLDAWQKAGLPTNR
jgi:protein-disulfide isomerase/rhodanese-related sulfurtransferase/uncharacterized membrane protein